MKPAVLIGLSSVFAWTVFRAAGVDPADWNITVLALAILLPLAWRGSSGPRIPGRIFWPLAGLTVWVLLQIVPLPAALVRVISPARGELASALGDSQWITVSAFPAVTLGAWMRLAGCVLVFLIARELAWHYSDARIPWVVVWPLILIASLEAVLGLVQAFSGDNDAGAHGTYHNRDHFAGLMEMTLPFAVMYGYSVWHQGRSRFVSPLRPAVVACGAFAVAAVLLLGSIYSLSRMGFITALFAVGVLGVARVSWKRWLLIGPVLAVILAIHLPPNQLIERFADLSTPDKLTSQDRVKIWRETVPLASSYIGTGCGLGTFEFVFPRFKHHAPLVVDNFAHNDYLQYLIELGVPGFSLGLILLGGILLDVVQAASRHSSVSGRSLAVACAASLAAILLHSLVDFNTYIPANAFALAWVSGITVSLMFSSRATTNTGLLVLKAKSRPA